MIARRAARDLSTVISRRLEKPPLDFGRPVEANYQHPGWANLDEWARPDDRTQLSNNLAENSMRGITLGRKNWLHVGSAQTGPKIAAILSVVESCGRIRMPVKDYLTAVLQGLGNRALSEVAHLTPARWSVSRA